MTPIRACASLVPVLCLRLALALGVTGCADTPALPAVPTPEIERFEEAAYPVLLADCGFAACHGSGERFLQVYGPGRTRLDPDTLPYGPATPEELALSYARASSFLIDADGPRRAPLLLKPLSVAAGGSGHEGDDPWGAPIYATKRAPGYQALFYWAISEEPEVEP